MTLTDIPQFAECSALLATMHGKESVIAPILLETLQLQVKVPHPFNTDTFGTFTRDVNRPGDQVQTARAKVKAMLEQFGGAIAIASEGAFGPHPLLPMLPCDREIVLLIDQRYGLEVVGEALSTQTNFNHCTIETLEQALEFAEKVGFPEHGLVAMLHADAKNITEIIKGIMTETQLIQAIHELKDRSTGGVIHLETDMRAMHNPTRMQVIAEATQNLVENLLRCCPACQWPNFTVIERKAGLPCGWCGAPTDLIRSVIYHCQHCGFKQESIFPNGQEIADPGQCQFCNP
jgi:hypothetical protein